MTNGELNRKISEARGWKAEMEPIPWLESGERVRYWHHPECTPTTCCYPKHALDIPNWCGSEDASAVLLEEMPWADLSRQDPTREWRCDPLGGAEGPHGNGLSVYDMDRKRVVAMAWLNWKGML